MDLVTAQHGELYSISYDKPEWKRKFFKEEKNGMGREEGGGFGMGNTCIPVADSLKKFIKKKKKEKNVYIHMHLCYTAKINTTL